MSIKREQVCNMLIWSDNNYTARIASNTPHLENVLVALEVRTEYLFIVAKSKFSLLRQEQRRHRLKFQLSVALLEDGTYVDHGIDIRI